MSELNMSDLATAYTLCVCGDVCSTQCTVCYSPAWESGPCVKQEYLNAAAEDTRKYRPGDLVPLQHLIPREKHVGVVPGTLPAYRRPAATRDEAIEQLIDSTEETYGPLQPWQAEAIRAILKRGNNNGAVQEPNTP